HRSRRPPPTTDASMSDPTEPIDPDWRPPNRDAGWASHRLPAPPVFQPVDDHVSWGPKSSGTVQMGARLVLLPAVVANDPVSTLVEPSVAEHHRFCRRCASPVGRGTNGSRAATSGRCNACDEPFQFEAPLRPGQVLANQYEIAGCRAHGGNGWVYLARDRAIDWSVVIKGVLSGHNPHARSAAL